MNAYMRGLSLGQFVMLRALLELPDFQWPEGAEFATMDQSARRVTFWAGEPFKTADIRFCGGGAVKLIRVDCVNWNWRESLTSRAEFMRAKAEMGEVV